MHKEIPVATFINAVAHKLNPRTELGGFYDLKFRDKYIKKMFRGAETIDSIEGRDDIRGKYIQVFGLPHKDSKNRESRSLRLYYADDRPNEISAIEWRRSNIEGVQEVYIANNRIEGSFEYENNKHYPDGWSLKIDNRGKVTGQTYVVRSGKSQGEEKRGDKLMQFSAKEIKKLKKAGFDPRLITLTSLLQREDHINAGTKDINERFRIWGKADLGLVTAAVLGILGLFPEKDPVKLSSMVGLTVYSLFFMINQYNVVKKGLSIPFREERNLSLQARDLRLYLSTFTQWLTQSWSM